MESLKGGTLHSSYINVFYGDIDRIYKYEIIRDFETSNEYRHWYKRYVDEYAVSTENQSKINYKILYTPSQYNMSYILNEYLDRTKILKTLTGYSEELTEQEQEKLNLFYKHNDWNNRFKSFIKNRKLYGDDFNAIVLKKINGYDIPIVTHLEPENVTIATSNGSLEYIYKTTIEEEIRISENSLQTITEDRDVQILIKKGAIITCENDTVLTDKTVIVPIDDVPIIHLQYLKKTSDEYSEIPSLSFIDGILRLHRIETNINEINDKSGAGQVYITDGGLDPDSTFGSRGVAYISSTSTDKQAKLEQIEITNGLDSLYREQDKVLNGLMSSANLLSPNTKEILAKNDSSKSIKFLNIDLIEELRQAYQEISDKTRIIWKLLFPNRKNENICLEIPTEILSSPLIDRMSYVEGNAILMRKILKEEGYSQEDIDIYVKDMAEQSLINKGKISPEKIEERRTLPSVDEIV